MFLSEGTMGKNKQHPLIPKLMSNCFKYKIQNPQNIQIHKTNISKTLGGNHDSLQN